MMTCQGRTHTAPHAATPRRKPSPAGRWGTGGWRHLWLPVGHKVRPEAPFAPFLWLPASKTAKKDSLSTYFS